MKQYPEQQIIPEDRAFPLTMRRQNGDAFSCPPECFYLAYRGSVAHGMYLKPEADGIDDIDLMGFCVGSRADYLGLGQWGSKGTKEVKAGSYDVVFYEIRKAVQLLLQGNPNIMSMLWVKEEDTLRMDHWARELRRSRSIFSGKHVYNAFAGYAHAQLLKMETRDPAELREYLAITAELKYRGAHPNHKGEAFPDAMDNYQDFGEAKNVRLWDVEKLIQRLRHYQKKGDNIGYLGEKRKLLVLENGFDSKCAAHLIRLLRMCIEFMDTGEFIVDRYDVDAAELLDIKKGKWKLEDIKHLSADLFEEAKQARDRSSLPDEPNRWGAEQLLMDIIDARITR